MEEIVQQPANEPGNMEEMVQQIRRRRGAAKSVWRRKFNSFYAAKDREVEQIVLKRMLGDVQTAYAKIEGINEDYEAMQDVTDTDEYMAEIDANMLDLNITYAAVESKVGLSAGESKSKGSSDSLKCKVDKLKTPVFDGKARDFAVFMDDYKRIVIPTFGNDAYVLRSCLRGPALLLVDGIGEDHDAMMTRLIDKYNDPKKVADLILSDVQKLQNISENDTELFIETITLIERAWLDVCRLDMKAIMANPLLVGQIERILPRTQLREWVLRSKRENYGPCESFEKLLEFLLEEKSMMEYCQSDIRRNNPAKSVHTTEMNRVSNEIESLKVDPILNLLKENQKMMNAVFIEAKTPDRNYINSSVRDQGCWLHNFNTSHTIENCRVFASMDCDRRLNEAKKHAVCFRCLATGHGAHNCEARTVCDIRIGTSVCGQPHHPLIHGGFRTASCNTTNIGKGKDSEAYLMTSKVKCQSKTVNVLWDSGANVSLVTFGKAKELEIQGVPRKIKINGLGKNSCHIRSKLFEIPLEKKNGEFHKIYAYGVDTITGDVRRPSIEKVTERFPHINKLNMQCGDGDIDVLIGTDHCSILPIVEMEKGESQLMKNQFGYCIRGKLETNLLGNNEIHRANVCCVNVDFLERLNNFTECESLEILRKPKCGNSPRGQSTIESNSHSRKREHEMHRIMYDAEVNKSIDSYPWFKNVLYSTNNMRMAVARVKQTERSLNQPAVTHIEPSSIVRKKWHTIKRNIHKGDISIAEDANAVHGRCTLAEGFDAVPGSSGLVCDVKM